MMRCTGLVVLFVLALPAGFSSAASPAIERACSAFVDPGFCIASLEAAPGSESADITGLQSIAHDLSVATAAATVARIEAYGKNATEPGVKVAVEACLILYRNTFPPLKFSAEFAALKRYDLAALMYEAPSFAPVDCGNLLMNGFDAAGDRFFKLMLMAKQFLSMM